MTTAKPANTMSYMDGIKALPVGYKIVRRWYDEGNLRDYLTYPNTKRFTPEDIERITNYIQPTDLLTFDDVRHYFGIGPKLLHEIMDDLQLQPVRPHDDIKVSPHRDLYSREQLPEISKQLRLKRSSNDYIDLTPNTDHQFDIDVDYSFAEASRKLHLGGSQYKLFYQWINGGRLKGHYSVDINGKVFLTPAQFQWIKHHYQKMPKDIYGGNAKMADALGITVNTLIKFRDYYQLPVVKVMGYQHVFYTNTTARKLMTWYQHPEERPYPYHLKAY